MEKVKVGIVGYGNMGSAHGRYVNEGLVKNIEITAICDLIPARLEAAKQDFPGVATFESAEEMYKSGVCEAVIIATPHYSHPALAISAFENGMHVLVEKPTGVYTKQVLEMNEAAKKSGKLFEVDFCMRVTPLYRTLKEFLTNTELGHIKRITWQVTNWYRPQAYHDSAAWRSTWATEGGGTLINQNPHQIDLWQWLFGMPDELMADVSFGKYYDIEVDDDVTAIMRYKNGTTGVYMTSTGEAPGTNRLDISCDMGRIVVENDKIIFDRNVMSERQWNADGQDDDIPTTREEIPVTYEWEINEGIDRNFADAILNGADIVAQGYDGIKELTMTNAMYLSAWKGNRWIDLNNFPHEEFWEELQKRIRTSKPKPNAPAYSNFQTAINKK